MLEYLTSFNNYGFLGVFIITLIAYSILPFPSEAGIIAASTFLNPYLVLLVAFIGSTIGIITSYIIGLNGLRKIIEKKNTKITRKAKKLFNKYGHLSILLFSWFPFIGDPLIILAGSFKMNFWKFLIYSIPGRILYFGLSIWAGFSIRPLL